LLEDTLVISTSALNRSRWVGLALLLLAVPACGLNEYEALMREAQEREEHYRAEQKYLGPPVEMPKQKDKQDKELPIANVFFRPPKGIQSKPQQLDDLRWRYPADSSGGDFVAVDMAFAEDNNSFPGNVCEKYGIVDRAPSPRIITPAGQKTSSTFEVWEFDNGQNRYSVNILKGIAKPIAIVYIFNKAKLDSVRQVIELSLQSVGADFSSGVARQRYDQKSPWKR
jgi:hypothetical protein